ncbi:hybrid sensory kinase in two-component regulatory system with RcsB and YojN [Yersinia enterocolitica]|uniref:hybrid sensor histidine kinase/response regulator n=1 Tax=Yersinia mollaretii TaxID=33060 RepID=UPI0005DFF70D|nr:hybrid sensor histidine kinase/response regulator [Yersinia mollaretii]CNK97340.1 hybrid sensory kinase in two-component regulatory system with RcsB and YojN [Yersinia enterocolitica]
MKPSGMENSYNYYKRVLLLSATLLSISLLLATLLGGYTQFESFITKQTNVLQVERDYVEIRTDQFTTRLKMFANLHEETETIHSHNRGQYELFIDQLRASQGVLLGSSLTNSLHYIFLLTPQSFTNSNVLNASTLSLLQDFAPAVAIRSRELGRTLDNFVYTRDGRFLAFLSPHDEEIRRILQSYPIDEIIQSQIQPTEQALKKYSLDYLRKKRVFWVPPHREALTGQLASYYAVPIFTEGKINEMVVVRVTSANFNYFFVSPDRPKGFFVASKDRQIVFGLDDSVFKGSELNWIDRFKTEETFKLPGRGEARLGHSGGVFYLSQLVNNGEWLAVYAFDWRSVASALYSTYIPLLAIILFIIGIIWWSISFFDKKVLIPFYRKSAALYESEVFNRTVVATAPVGLAVIDQQDRHIIFENDIAAELLNQAQQDHSYFYQQILEEHTEIFLHRENASLEKVISRPSGLPPLEIDLTVVRTRYLNHDVLLFSLLDISKRKETERLLIDAKSIATQANKAKTMFVANVSHEIRNPLHGALGNLELLELEVTEPPALARIDTINRSLHSLLSIVNKILDLTRIEAEELHINNRPFDLIETLEQCVQTYAPLIVKKNVRFYFIMGFVPKTLFYGDSQRISQIVINLLSNAYKFTDSGVITLRIQQSKEGLLGISVADSGCGISQDMQKSVYQPFVQDQASGSHPIEGTGLGLSLCEHLAKLMDGSIELESEVGIGSIFTVHIPLLSTATPVPRLTAFTSLCSQTISLYCDNPNWQHSLHLLMECYGLSITTIHSLAALEQNETPQVLVCATSHPGFILPQNVINGCQQVVHITPDGPLSLQREGDLVSVSAFSVFQILSSLASCFGITPDIKAVKAQKMLSTYQTRTILVAEDNSVNRMLIRQQLSVLGLNNVCYVENGQQAFEQCQRQTFDLVITDLHMPQMGGEELMARLRAIGQHMPVAVITATLIKEGEFDAVLHKPVGLEQLQDTLALLLGQVSLPSEPLPTLLPITDDMIRAEFLKGWDSDRQQIEQAIVSGDITELRSLLHRVEGALLVLNLRAEAVLCKALHDACFTLSHAQMHKNWQPIKVMITGQVAGW